LQRQARGGIFPKKALLLPAVLSYRSSLLVSLMAAAASCAGIDDRADGGARRDGFAGASGGWPDVGNSPEPEPCEAFGVIEITPRPADVLILLDRSGSMDTAFGSSSRYRALATELTDLVTTYQRHVRFGYIEMPGKSGCETQSPGCCASPPSVELALGNADTMAGAIAGAWPVGGNTPTASALLAARLYYLSLSDGIADRYVLLATDGVPSCTLSGLLGDGTSTFSQPCIDALTQVQALNTMGVKVMLLSVGQDAAASTAQTNCLDALARAGGGPISSDGPAYYSASDPDRLRQAVEQIFGGVTRPSCTLAMPPVEDPSLVDVFLDGQRIPHASGDGWHWDSSTSPPGIQITGVYCQRIQTFQVSASISANAVPRRGYNSECLDRGVLPRLAWSFARWLRCSSVEHVEVFALLAPRHRAKSTAPAESTSLGLPAAPADRPRPFPNRPSACQGARRALAPCRPIRGASASCRRGPLRAWRAG
jgi:hypothetical protein